MVFVAGRPSHGYASHEAGAGSLLLADALNENVPDILAAVYRNGWPKDPDRLRQTPTRFVLFSDGGGGNPILPHLAEVGKLMQKGVGLAALHYAVEVPKGEAGNDYLDWIGGYFEQFWSVNPHFKAKVIPAKDHPVTRGRQALHDRGRMVLPHALPRQHGGRDAHSHDRSARQHARSPRRPAQREPNGSCRQGAKRRYSPGPVSGPTAAAASASPAATGTGIGATTSFARSC